MGTRAAYRGAPAMTHARAYRAGGIGRVGRSGDDLPAAPYVLFGPVGGRIADRHASNAA